VKKTCCEQFDGRDEGGDGRLIGMRCRPKIGGKS